MIKFVPDERPWEDSPAFAQAFNEAVASQAENPVRMALLGTGALFAGENERAFETNVDREGIAYDLVTEDRVPVADDLFGAVRVALEELPLDEARRLVEQRDSLVTLPPPREVEDLF